MKINFENAQHIITYVKIVYYIPEQLYNMILYPYLPIYLSIYHLSIHPYLYISYWPSLQLAQCIYHLHSFIFWDLFQFCGLSESLPYHTTPFLCHMNVVHMFLLANTFLVLQKLRRKFTSVEKTLFWRPAEFVLGVDWMCLNLDGMNLTQKLWDLVQGEITLGGECQCVGQAQAWCFMFLISNPWRYLKGDIIPHLRQETYSVKVSDLPQDTSYKTVNWDFNPCIFGWMFFTTTFCLFDKANSYTRWLW